VSGTVLGVVLNKNDRRTMPRYRHGLITATQEALLLNSPTPIGEGTATIGEGAANPLRHVHL